MSLPKRVLRPPARMRAANWVTCATAKMVRMRLLEALGAGPGSVVAAVGGGGKTSLVFRLAMEAQEAGIPVVVTTTVRFTRPAGLPVPPVIEADDRTAAVRCAAALDACGAVTLVAGEGTRGRWLGFDPGTIDGLAQPDRLIVVEADGSAHRPFKAPAEHEPVIPARSTHVVVCVGVGVLGRPLDERWVHRPERVAALAGVAAGSVVDVAMVARVLCDPQGGGKGVPAGALRCALLNQAGAARGAEAYDLGRLLAAGGYARVLVGVAHEGQVEEVRGDGVVSTPATHHG